MPSDEDLRLRALNNLGGVYLELGDVDQAEPAFRKAVDLGPHYADALINLGNALLTRVQTERDPTQRAAWLAESVEYYKRGLKEEPNNFFGFGNLGVAMQELGQLSQAERAYRHAVFLNPAHFGSLTNLAALLLTRAESTADVGEQRRLLLEARQIVGHSLALNPAQSRAPEVLRRVTAALDSMGES